MKYDAREVGLTFILDDISLDLQHPGLTSRRVSGHYLFAPLGCHADPYISPSWIMDGGCGQVQFQGPNDRKSRSAIATIGALTCRHKLALVRQGSLLRTVPGAGSNTYAHLDSTPVSPSLLSGIISTITPMSSFTSSNFKILLVT